MGLLCLLQFHQATAVIFQVYQAPAELFPQFCQAPAVLLQSVSSRCCDSSQNYTVSTQYMLCFPKFTKQLLWFVQVYQAPAEICPTILQCACCAFCQVYVAPAVFSARLPSTCCVCPSLPSTCCSFSHNFQACAMCSQVYQAPAVCPSTCYRLQMLPGALAGTFQNNVFLEKAHFSRLAAACGGLFAFLS